MYRHCVISSNFFLRIHKYTRKYHLQFAFTCLTTSKFSVMYVHDDLNACLHFIFLGFLGMTETGCQKSPGTTVTPPILYFLTLRQLMSYIYMEHPFLMFLDHTQRRSTVGRTPLDE